MGNYSIWTAKPPNGTVTFADGIKLIPVGIFNSLCKCVIS